MAKCDPLALLKDLRERPRNRTQADVESLLVGLGYKKREGKALVFTKIGCEPITLHRKRRSATLYQDTIKSILKRVNLCLGDIGGEGDD